MKGVPGLGGGRGLALCGVVLMTMMGTNAGLQHYGAAAGAAGGAAALAEPAAIASAPPLYRADVKPPSVELTWKASPSPVMGYNVYRATAPKGEMRLLNATPVAGTSYEDRAVERGRTYYYVTRAVAADGGLSAPSNETMASIPKG